MQNFRNPLRLAQRGRTLVLAVVVTLLGTAALSWASIPSDSGQLDACYANDTGALRLIDADAGLSECSSDETSVSWSQQGPKGDPGPSDTYFAWANLNGQRITSRTSSSPYGVQLLDVTLPAGSYVVNGGMKASGSEVATNVACYLYRGDSPAGGSIDTASARIAKGGGFDPDQTLDLPLDGFIASSSQVRVRAACNPGSEATGANGPFIDIGFTATRVGKVTYLPSQ
jgi:hypothetical protein